MGKKFTDVAVYRIVNGTLTVAVWNGDAGKFFENYPPSTVAGSTVDSDSEAVRLVRGTGWSGLVLPIKHPVAQLLPLPSDWDERFNKPPKWVDPK